MQDQGVRFQGLHGSTSRSGESRIFLSFQEMGGRRVLLTTPLTQTPLISVIHSSLDSQEVQELPTGFYQPVE